MGTEHYHLKQWETWERPGRAGLNGNFAALDAAVFDKADKAATAAQLTALDGRVETVIGSYVGDGVINRVITLGFTPKAVLLEDNGGRRTTGDVAYGGLALEGAPLNGGSGTVMEIVSGGFRVNANRNTKNKSFRYLAFRQ